jgi:hypothetical protein
MVGDHMGIPRTVVFVLLSSFHLWSPEFGQLPAQQPNQPRVDVEMWNYWSRWVTATLSQRLSYFSTGRSHLATAAQNREYGIYFVELMVEVGFSTDCG